MYDKYGSRNPIARRLMAGFLDSFDALAAQARGQAAVQSVFEVGCGEGMLALRLARAGLAVQGCDLDPGIVAVARDNAVQAGLAVPFSVASIHDALPLARADLVVACEVFEHLAQPEAALDNLAAQGTHLLLASVPREPLWRALNMARGKYLGALGNTPGHLQHWGTAGFLRFIGRRADILAVRRPLPWTMVLARIRHG